MGRIFLQLALWTAVFPLASSSGCTSDTSGDGPVDSGVDNSMTADPLDGSSTPMRPGIDGGPPVTRRDATVGADGALIDEPTGDSSTSGPGPRDAAIAADAGLSDGSATHEDSGVGQDDGGTMVGKLCGTRGAGQCGARQFCDYAPAAQCGALDQGGVCKPKTTYCTEIYSPVCGCDDHTYGNSCTAQSAGVSVKHDGECTPTTTGHTCGGIANLQCAAGSFCNYAASAGGLGCGPQIADASGVCQVKPPSCATDPNQKPVCGCDKRTYDSACDANTQGMSVYHTGACTDVDCKANGGEVVGGRGPAPVCPQNATSTGSVSLVSGAIPIEGAICCIKLTR